jgi:peptidoglycan/LPS O-acetylase OafA/YrhL
LNTDVDAPQSSNSFRPDIEGLRAVAILLVVGCHCGISWCAGGFIGVDVFFVLSGYLITGLLMSEYREKSRIQLLRFYARRARRLLPACALVLLATTLFAALVLSPNELEFTARAARAAGLYLSNVFFDQSASDYFSPNVQGNPLLHTWSLGLEEQFYLAWPLLVLAIGRGPAGFERPIWILGAVAVLSFTYCLYSTRAAPTVAFYEMPARAWEFAAGGVLVLLPVTGKSQDSGWAVAGGIVGMAVILLTAIMVKGGAGFPGSIALFPVAGTLAILFAGANAPRRGIGTLLGVSPLQFIGSRSYSWYLWHWPFVVFAMALFPGVQIGGTIVAAIASLLAATLTFRFVERPIRESPYFSARSRLSLVAAAGVTLLTAATSWTTILFGRQLMLDQRFRAITAATADFSDISQKSCWSEGPSFQVKLCEFGVPDASHAVVLFGDSHALQWFNPMRTAAIAESWRLITVLRPGCAASYINPHNLSTAADHCKEWRDNAIDKIIALRPSAVVMASYNGATLRGDSFTATLMPTEEIRLGTQRTLVRLSRAGVPIVILRDTPLPPYNIPACVAQREVGKLHTPESCDFDASVALNNEAFFAEQSAADGLANVYFLDLSDLICPARFCPATQHGLIVYRDENHLTATYAESLAPVIRMRLFQLLRNAH